MALGADACVVRTEVNAVIEDDFVAHYADLLLVRAAIVVGVAVGGLWFVRAEVFDVGNAVLVVILVGAAVRVLETVFVLGLVWATVGLVEDSVLVVVLVGAAVVVLEAILVF